MPRTREMLRAYHRAYRQRNLEKMRAYHRVYYLAHKIHKQPLTEAQKQHRQYMNRIYKRAHRYGLSRAEFDRLFTAQQGLCAICGVPFIPGQVVPTIDHNHTTGVVRGLLCRHCNVALGRFRDSIPTIQKALNYLLKHL